MDFLSYKLEEYVNTYVADQSQENAYIASKALELIAKDYVNGVLKIIENCLILLKNMELRG